MYTSARQPPPGKGSSTLRLEVMDAMSLWKAIPTEKIPDVVSDAIVGAGNFLATNGLVAKCWADRTPKEWVADFAAIGRRDQEAEKRYLSAPDNRQPTQEERDANAKMMAEIARKLAQ